jgi:hypothetical protein
MNNRYLALEEIKILRFEDLGLNEDGKFYVSKFTLNIGTIEIKFPFNIKNKGMINATNLRNESDKRTLLNYGVLEKEWDRFVDCFSAEDYEKNVCVNRKE